MRSKALAAEGEVRRAGEAAEFAGGVSQVHDRAGRSDGPAGRTLVPVEAAGADFRGDFGAAFGVTRDEQEAHIRAGRA